MTEKKDIYKFGNILGQDDLIIETFFGQATINISRINGQVPAPVTASQLWMTNTYTEVLPNIDIQAVSLHSYIEENARDSAFFDFIIKEKPVLSGDFIIEMEMDFSNLPDSQLWVQTQTKSAVNSTERLTNIGYDTEYNSSDRAKGYAIGDSKGRFDTVNKITTQKDHPDSRGRKIRFVRTDGIQNEYAYFAIADTRMFGTAQSPQEGEHNHSHPAKSLENINGKDIFKIIVPKEEFNNYDCPIVIRQGFHRSRDVRYNGCEN